MVEWDNMQQSIKQFLKPDYRKIIAIILLGIVFSLFCHTYADRTLSTQEFQSERSRVIELPSQITECGFPLNYLKAETSPLCVLCISDFSVNNVLNLIIDLLIWYFIACIVIFFLSKIKRNLSKIRVISKIQKAEVRLRGKVLYFIAGFLLSSLLIFIMFFMPYGVPFLVIFLPTIIYLFIENKYLTSGIFLSCVIYIILLILSIIYGFLG